VSFVASGGVEAGLLEEAGGEELLVVAASQPALDHDGSEDEEVGEADEEAAIAPCLKPARARRSKWALLVIPNMLGGLEPPGARPR
jgi:hypothetical protein